MAYIRIRHGYGFPMNQSSEQLSSSGLEPLDFISVGIECAMRQLSLGMKSPWTRSPENAMFFFFFFRGKHRDSSIFFNHHQS